MKNYNQTDIVLTGIGITSAIGQGKECFTEGLIEGKNAFGIMQRPGRQKDSSFIGAEISSITFPESISKRALRNASFSGKVAMATLYEAWEDAKLDIIEPERIGLVIGGSNCQQRELTQTYENYRERIHFMPPSYGFSFLDTDLCGLCTEQFGIRGFAYTVGAASASGQACIINAVNAVMTGQVEVCIAIGALMDISYWECQAMRSLGAMGTDKYANEPSMACRPFDQQRDGFIYGEACGVVVVEKAEHAIKRGISPYAAISGCGMKVDGNRNPNPSYDGEVFVIKKALEQARISACDIDYINAHGTGSMIGDEIELRAIRDCHLSHAFINATKSITGHGLSAAGAVEVISTALQMKASMLHPTRNLENPMEQAYNWVRNQAVQHKTNHAISLSMGFGGINTAICLSRL